MAEPAPIPTNMWGGPDKVYAFEDLGMSIHAANFRVAGDGSVVFSVANGEGVWVIDGRDLLDFARDLSKYLDHLASVGQDITEEKPEAQHARSTDTQTL